MPCSLGCWPLLLAAGVMTGTMAGVTGVCSPRGAAALRRQPCSFTCCLCGSALSETHPPTLPLPLAGTGVAMTAGAAAAGRAAAAPVTAGVSAAPAGAPAAALHAAQRAAQCAAQRAAQHAAQHAAASGATAAGAGAPSGGSAGD